MNTAALFALIFVTVALFLLTIQWDEAMKTMREWERSRIVWAGDEAMLRKKARIALKELSISLLAPLIWPIALLYMSVRWCLRMGRNGVRMVRDALKHVDEENDEEANEP